MEQKEKINIAVCDDEQYVHDEIKRFIRTYAEEKKIEYCLSHLYSANELLSFPNFIDILLLDIEMPEMDGIEAAYKLNDKGMDCKIIMLTCRTDRFKEAFKIGAIRFVTKPIEKIELFEAMDEARVRMIGHEMVQVSCDNRSYSIMQKDIVYIMADGSSTRIFTQKNVYRSENTLSGWEKILNKKIFFMCHRSYLINLSNITQIDKSTAVLTTGEKVPISRRKRTELTHAHMEFDLKIR